MAVSILTKF